jgi:hypothetical protein
VGKGREKQAKKHALTPEMEAVKWKPGQSGNPKGRPKKEFCLTSLVKAELEAQAADKSGKMLKNDDGTPKTWAQILASAIVRQAAKGNPSALNQLWDRMDGKVPLPLEHGGKGGGPLKVSVVLTDKAKKAGGNGGGNGSG